MNWEEAKEIYETLTDEEMKLYRNLKSKYDGSGLDGHDIHLSVMEKIKEKRVI